MKKYFIVFTLFFIVSCNDKMFTKVKEVSSDQASMPDQSSPIKFDGIQSVHNITESTAEIYWTHTEGAATYSLFIKDTSGFIVKKVAIAPEASLKINSLTKDTQYEAFLVMMDKNGLTSSNRKRVTFRTKNENNMENNKSLLFSGNQNIELKESFKTFKHPQVFSLAFWFKLTDTQLEETKLLTFHRGINATENMSLGVKIERKLSFKFINAAGEFIHYESSKYLNIGEWYFVSLVSNKNKIELYLNAEKLKTFDQILSAFGQHKASLGSRSGIQNGFVGQIDEVSFWDKPLAEGDIRSLYLNNNEEDLTKLSHISMWLRMGDDPTDDNNQMRDQISGEEMRANGFSSGDILQDTP